ncbi:MAG: GNAT family N-acetyltransferase [Flavobacteriales bacterium]
MKLHGENCFLRAVEPHDVEWLFKWENNTDNWVVSGTKIPFSKHQLQGYIQGIRDIYTDKQLRLIICTEEKPVGTLDLYDYDPSHRRAGLGILIGDESQRRKGIAKDAIKATIDYAFKILLLHQIYVTIPSFNKASIELFEQCGFKPCGIRKEWMLTDSGWHDEHLFQLINE